MSYLLHLHDNYEETLLITLESGTQQIYSYNMILPF